MPSSAMPEAYVYARGEPGRARGTILSKGVGDTKCKAPTAASIVAIFFERFTAMLRVDSSMPPIMPGEGEVQGMDVRSRYRLSASSAVQGARFGCAACNPLLADGAQLEAFARIFAVS